MQSPTDDEFISVVRSEERLRADVVRTPVQRAVLRKVIVSEERTITVTERREEFRIDYEPVSAVVDQPSAEPRLPVGPIEIVLHEERFEIVRTVVPVERIRIEIRAVTEAREVTEAVRVERVETEGPDDIGASESSGRHRL